MKSSLANCNTKSAFSHDQWRLSTKSWYKYAMASCSNGLDYCMQRPCCTVNDIFLSKILSGHIESYHCLIIFSICYPSVITNCLFKTPPINALWNFSAGLRLAGHKQLTAWCRLWSVCALLPPLTALCFSTGRVAQRPISIKEIIHYRQISWEDNYQIYHNMPTLDPGFLILV